MGYFKEFCKNLNNFELRILYFKFNYLLLHSGKSYTTSSFRIPQVWKQARV